MKNSLLILAGAAALTFSSCSQEKTTETTTDTTTTTETSGSAMSAADTEAMIQARAQRIADRMVADMKISDDATKERIRTVYLTRAQRVGGMRSQYATDTTGMAAAMRDANAATDAEFKTIFTDPTQYRAYESSRNTYYSMENEEPSVSTDMASGTGSDMNATGSNTGSTSGTPTSGMSDVDKMKMKSADGSKVKVKSDGDVKIKDAQDNKLKVDGDDGTVKMKPENGEKTKIK
ncbi:hypothetical protein [Hymenobacter saemangeumensis]